MKVYIENTEYTLNDKTYVAYGGEADIHSLNGNAFKLYHADSAPMKTIGYDNKIQSLTQLKHKNIVAPKEILRDSSGLFIGYTMPFIDSVEPLTKLMTKSYKSRNHISTDALIELILKMREVYQFIHDKKCVVVDGNDNNILFRKDNKSFPYFIDVDSYKTPKFAGSAYSPLITDPKINPMKNEFSALTDWYSFAVVTFQLLTNIHPFKGKHPNYTQKQVSERMLDGVSVFSKDVQLPGSVESFDIIPTALKTWYEEIFSNSKRTLPPLDFTKNAPLKPKETVVYGNTNLIVLETSIKRDDAPSLYSDIIVGNQYTLTKTVNGFGVYSPMHLNVPNSVQKFYRCAYYQIGGIHHFAINSSDRTEEMFHTIVPLEKTDTILDASYEGGIFVISFKDKDGKFWLKLFKKEGKFSPKLNDGYALETSTFSECNFTVLNSGVVLLLTADGELLITHKSSEQYKIVKRTNLPTDGVLFNKNGNVFFEHKYKVYQIKMK